VGELGPLVALSARVAGEPVVLLGMGPRGLATRVLASRLGSAWTYAGGEAGVGQLPAAKMIDEFHVRRVTDKTDVFGIVGSPVIHSLSPVMHNAGFVEAGIDAVYVPLDAADADDALQGAALFNLIGLSVTAPLKVDLMSRVGRVDAVAARVGALNTLRRAGDGWEATNTDVAGFLAPLKSGTMLHGRLVTILGAGGAARAAAVALSDAGASVSVSARRPDAAAAIAALGRGTVTPFPPPPGSWQVLVNTTPVGMAGAGDESPIDPRLLAGGSLVYDLVYWPPMTRLMSDAQRAGCRTLGGLPMLVAQAERQFEWWTGVTPRAGLFAETARARLTASAEEVEGPVVRPARHE
jgi:3-dehydroquinate dehydratase/shikimate dehydrogenase